MLFCFSRGRYQILKYSYLTNYKIGSGLFSTVKIDNKLSPYTPTAIDLSRHNVYKKIHQEYLERYRVAHNTNNFLKLESFNPFEKKICTHNRNILGYGFNDEYGSMDTTGTASGFYSNILKEKALLELIEKNEIMLIWYLAKGYNVLIEQDISNLIKCIGFYSEEIYIFCSNNLCNITTFAVFLFHNEKIVSTGINADKDSKQALFKALLEAKLLETYYRDSTISPYKIFNKDDYKEIYEFIKNLSKKMKSTSFVEDVKREIILSPWISSIEFALLNTKLHQDYVTIRCFSKELLNCVPGKQNILRSLDKLIFKKYNIDENAILSNTQCVIL